MSSFIFVLVITLAVGDGSSYSVVKTQEGLTMKECMVKVDENKNIGHATCMPVMSDKN